MSYLRFEESGTSESGKTKIWRVSCGQELGLIKWFAAWRRYVFVPVDRTVYDASCLTEVSNFCHSKTLEHKH
jgi:hypothetical protein